MKKLILISIFVIIILLSWKLTFAQTSSEKIKVTDPEAWRYFYQFFRPAADVACLQGSTTFEKINNCLIRVLGALQYIAVIIFLISLTLIAGFLIFSPANKEYLDLAKKTFFWTILGFIIIFIAKEILEAINQLMR